MDQEPEDEQEGEWLRFFRGVAVGSLVGIFIWVVGGLLAVLIWSWQ